MLDLLTELARFAGRATLLLQPHLERDIPPAGTGEFLAFAIKFHQAINRTVKCGLLVTLTGGIYMEQLHPGADIAE
jgi:hypothetical protein